MHICKSYCEKNQWHLFYMKSVGNIFKLTWNCVHIWRSLCDKFLNLCARCQQLIDIKSRPTDLDWNFLSYPAALFLVGAVV